MRYLRKVMAFVFMVSLFISLSFISLSFVSFASVRIASPSNPSEAVTDIETATPPGEAETAESSEAETAEPAETETATPSEAETAAPVEAETATPTEAAMALGPAVYYVDGDGGDDGNTGMSETDAWRTLDMVNSTVFHPGDQILLKSGCTWNGRLAPQGSGSAEAPISIDCYGQGENPLILGGEADKKVLSLINQGYWEINHLRISSSVTHNRDRRTGIWVENKNQGTIEHIYIKNCEIFNIPSKDTNSDVECLFGGISITGYGSSSKYNDVRIEDNYVHDLCKGGITTYTYNEDRNKWDAAFGYSTNVYIANNTVRNVKGDGIVAKNVDGAVIEYNVCDGAANGGAGSSAQYGCYAGIWGAFCKNSVFRYNEVYNTHRFQPGNNDGMAFDADIKCENVVFEYNYSHDNQGGFFLDMGDSLNTVVRYNISQNDQSRLFMFAGNTRLHVNAYNNTFYIGEGLSTEIQDSHFASAGNDVKYTNNIFYNLGTGAYNQGGAVFTHNCFYGGGSKPGGAGNIIADPGLAAPGSGGTGIDFQSGDRLSGYELTAASPCINAGGAMSGNGGQDFWGNPLYHGQPDIGADESAYEAPEQGVQLQINDNDGKIVYLGSWTYDTACAGGYSGDSHYTSSAGASAAFTFKGTSVSWLGQKDANYGMAQVYLDGVLKETVDCYDARNLYQQILFSAADLTPEEHTLRIVCTGQKNPASQDANIDVDSIVYTRSTTASLVDNGGFESGAAYPWKPYNSALVVDQNQHSGSYGAKLGKNSSYEQVISVEPNSSYVLKAWVKVSNAGSVMTLGVKDYGGSETFSTSTDTQYKQITVTFTTGAASQNATIYGYRQNNGKGDGFLDDVTLEKAADVSTYDPLKNAAAPLDIPTYEGTSQPTHPSVVRFEKPWNGYTYWMAMTPYPFNNGSLENPSIVASSDGVNWIVPQGVTNPLVNTPAKGHNCDVDLVYVPNGDELRMYYVDADDIISSSIKMIRTTDGANWSAPVTVLKDPVKKYSMLSPSIEILPNGTYMMWFVDAGNTGWNNQSNTVKYCTSDDGISWSGATACSDFVQPGYQVWHIDVHYDPASNCYYAVFPAYPNGTDCDHCKLFFAINRTGNKWEFFSKPILKPSGSNKWDDFCIYRSSMVMEGNVLKVWYGAKKQEDSSWHIGLSQRDFTEFLNALDS